MKKLTSEEFIEKAKKIHGDKYSYSKTNYISYRFKVEIICKIHGSFFQRPNHHLTMKSGCPKCKFQKLLKICTKTKDTFISDSIKIHGNRYDYSNVLYKNSKEKIKIICKLHGPFFQQPSNHLEGKGCSKCNSSKGEIKISQLLDNNNIKYVTQKSFEDCKNPKTNYKLRYDFYIPSKNLLIEYDGKQHYKSDFKLGKYQITKKDVKYIQYKDKIKTKYAKNKGIKLLRIGYKSFNKINKLILNEKQKR